LSKEIEDFVEGRLQLLNINNLSNVSQSPSTNKGSEQQTLILLVQNSQQLLLSLCKYFFSFNQLL
jgi:hypothetical protein